MNWKNFFKNRWALWGARYAALLVVFLAFYLPFHLQWSRSAEDFKTKSKRIDELRKGELELLSPKEMADLKKRADDFEIGFIDSSRIDLLLGYISDNAIRHHFKVTKINSDVPVKVTDAQGQEVLVGEKKLLRIPINLRFEADYVTLANFLRSFNTDNKYSMTTEHHSFKKKDLLSELVQCEMTLSFFSTG